MITRRDKVLKVLLSDHKKRNDESESGDDFSGDKDVVLLLEKILQEINSQGNQITYTIFRATYLIVIANHLKPVKLMFPNKRFRLNEGLKISCL